MAKVECFTPDGVMEMKEPVDAKECVENCGYTMEAPEAKGSVMTVGVDVQNDKVEVSEPVESPAPKVDGRRKKRNR